MLENIFETGPSCQLKPWKKSAPIDVVRSYMNKCLWGPRLASQKEVVNRPVEWECMTVSVSLTLLFFAFMPLCQGPAEPNSHKCRQQQSLKLKHLPATYRQLIIVCNGPPQGSFVRLFPVGMVQTTERSGVTCTIPNKKLTTGWPPISYSGILQHVIFLLSVGGSWRHQDLSLELSARASKSHTSPFKHIQTALEREKRSRPWVRTCLCAPRLWDNPPAPGPSASRKAGQHGISLPPQYTSPWV